MAFLLRFISRSADGREIIRTSELREDLLRVGRDPNSDIRLNDLAVALHHATLELVGGGQLGVSAEAGLTIEIDGVATSFGQIALPSGGDIRVGPFLLRIMPVPAGTHDIAIDIERAEDDAVAEKVDVRRFALASVMPGKRPMAWVLVILVLGLTLAWPIWSFYQGRSDADHYAQGYHPDRMWNAGPLSRAHASLEH
ncbi:MAG: cytochrome C, partial [Alphaproteobacteria bacterium]|nr:cytochrome C [Alphaproteobacteria bacterium]